MQNENLTPNGGANMPANQPQMPPSAAPKKSNKPLMIGLGALGLVVVVGLAVSLSQGDLFKGQLQLRDSAMTLTTKNDFSAEVKNLNLDLSQNIGQIQSDGRDYNLLIDKRATNSVSFKDNVEVNSAEYSKAGLGNDLYLKITPVRTASTRDSSSTSLSSSPVIDSNSLTQNEATRTQVDTSSEEVTANTTINATATMPSSNSNEVTAADTATATVTAPSTQEEMTANTTLNATVGGEEFQSTTDQKDLQLVESDAPSTIKLDQGVTTSSTTTENERNRNNPDGLTLMESSPELTKTEDSSDLRKLESSLINVAHAAISNEMSCEIDKNFIVKCSDISEYPNKLYSVKVNNAPELSLNYGLRVSNSSCKDFDGFRFDPESIDLNNKDAAKEVKMYAYLGNEEFSVEDICMASLKEMGASNGVTMTLHEAGMAAIFSQSNLQVSDLSKEQTLFNGFMTASAGGALKLDLSKTNVGGNISTLKDNTTYQVVVSANQKTLSPALKIQSLAKTEETLTPVVVTPVQPAPTVVVVPDRTTETLTPVAITGTRERNCTNLDRLAFSPTALTYTEGEAKTVVATTLSGYQGAKDVGIPFDQNICPETITNLQLEGSGFYVEVVNNSSKQTSTQLLDMSEEALEKMGQKAILEGFTLFNGVMNVKLTQNADKQIKLVFNNDLSKRDLGNGFTMMAGQDYRVNLKGVRLKDTKAGKVTSNYAEGDKVLTSYSLRINERPAAATTTQTTTTTTTPERPVQTTERSAEPCVVDGRNYYLAEGPNSSYCKDLQGLSTVLKTDQAPETPQVRYTTALAVQRIINEIIAAKDLDARFRVRNVSTTWYNALVDGNQIARVSSQEMADFKNVYATGILKGRIDPKDNSEITLAPLDQVTYAELLSILRQAVASVLGVNPTIKDNNLPAFLLSDYRENPDLKWVAEAVSFGVEYKIIEKDEFNRETLFSVASRADMASFLTKFRAAISANPALLAR